MDWKKWLRWMGFFALAACVQVAFIARAEWWYVFPALLLAAPIVAGLVWLDGVLARRKSRQVRD